MTTHTTDSWMSDYNEIVAFGAVLLQSGSSAGDLLYYFEKPWKWDNEYHRWEAAGRPDEIDLMEQSEELMQGPDEYYDEETT